MAATSAKAIIPPGEPLIALSATREDTLGAVSPLITGFGIATDDTAGRRGDGLRGFGIRRMPLAVDGGWLAR